MKPSDTGITRVIKAGGYSYQGLLRAWKSEAAFRQELVLALVLIPLALIVNVSALEQIAMIAGILLVLIVELINSAIEAVVDRVGLEHHELSGAAKDMGSAAVAISLLLVAFIWIRILLF